MKLLDPKAKNIHEQFQTTVSEMKKYPHHSANYVTLKIHAGQLLDELLDTVPDEFVEALYEKIQEVSR